jgi:REP element-mobilizing transposase RayT
MLSDGFFDRRKPFWIRWGNLPHWRQEGALYFVTFRLSDSLPAERLDELRRLRQEWKMSRERSESGAHGEELLRKSRIDRRRVERWLDLGSGSCILQNRSAIEIVQSAIRHFDGVRYELGRLTVAANHVHVLVRTADGIDLSDVLYSWKRYSSRQLRKIARFSRPFAGRKHLWQPESFDHIVRNGRELDRIDAYIAGHDDQRL